MTRIQVRAQVSIVLRIARYSILPNILSQILVFIQSDGLFSSICKCIRICFKSWPKQALTQQIELRAAKALTDLCTSSFVRI